jgi:uncharacterized protein (TIGR02448 family)
MKILIATCGILLAAGQVQASPGAYVEGTFWASGFSLMSSSEYANYYTQQVQDDAAVYVATGGETTGPALEKAILDNRALHRDSHLSDMEIANNLLLGSFDQAID